MERFDVESSEENLICSSLRRHEPWGSVATQILQSGGKLWKETNLESYDIALLLPREFQECSRHFRFLLLSPVDIERDGAMTRIKQLYDLGGYVDMAVVFLVDENRKEGATASFMKLQLDIMASDIPRIPVVPLFSPEALTTTLQSFMASLVSSRVARSWPADATQDLLPYCIVNASLSSQSLDVLSNNSLSFRDLLVAVATDEGCNRISDIIGQAEAPRMFSFWTHEFAIP
ncbi:hypothetical protein B0T25DRAFT_350642 [Lasiosphaeria hispida]|uniref:Uncharacterized protein n=1 Tax=Lasiosphaeria hispida TaxID=260671 RepID=A0AAJ0M8D4_9PEZI|nr:hypothetical protein B0T25DRAFT_350642 [Lasiosphaeria hispida]